MTFLKKYPPIVHAKEEFGTKLDDWNYLSNKTSVLCGTTDNSERVFKFSDDSYFNHLINCDDFIYTMFLSKKCKV